MGGRYPAGPEELSSHEQATALGFHMQDDTQSFSFHTTSAKVVNNEVRAAAESD